MPKNPGIDFVPLVSISFAGACLLNSPKEVYLFQQHLSRGKLFDYPYAELETVASSIT